MRDIFVVVDNGLGMNNTGYRNVLHVDFSNHPLELFMQRNEERRNRCEHELS